MLANKHSGVIVPPRRMAHISSTSGNSGGARPESGVEIGPELVDSAQQFAKVGRICPKLGRAQPKFEPTSQTWSMLVDSGPTLIEFGPHSVTVDCRPDLTMCCRVCPKKSAQTRSRWPDSTPKLPGIGHRRSKVEHTHTELIKFGRFRPASVSAKFGPDRPDFG